VEGDLTAPAPVTDVQATAVGATRVSIAFTVSGDDGVTGQAAALDIRVSDSPLDEASFALAAPVAAPVPGAAGTVQNASIPVAPGSTQYIALRVLDEAGNASSLSNVLEVTTDPGTLIAGEGAESGAPAWTRDGLWHVTERFATEGSHSLWYGDENSGTYDTGTTNQGSLTSPVLDLGASPSAVLTFQEYLETENSPYYDRADVLITDVDDPSSTRLIEKPGDSYGVFRRRMIALDEFLGKRMLTGAEKRA
jgi:hypothetical protein